MNTFIMAHEIARNRALDAVKNAPEGWQVIVKPATRTT